MHIYLDADPRPYCPAFCSLTAAIMEKAPQVWFGDILRLTDIMKFGVTAMKNRKLRAILTIIGIAMGPATITALVAATGGFANQATAQFNKLGAGTVLVTPAGRGVTLQADDQAILSKIDGVKLALPFFRLQA